MKCEICGEEKDQLILLPIKKEDGSLDTLACYNCAIHTKEFCLHHDNPHIGFSDNTTVCLHCVEETLEFVAGKASVIFERLQLVLADEEWQELLAHIGPFSEASGISLELALLRLVVMKSLRVGLTIEEILELIEMEQSYEALCRN